MANMDFNEFMKMVSNMDKKELENKMKQVSDILKNMNNNSSPNNKS